MRIVPIVRGDRVPQQRSLAWLAVDVFFWPIIVIGLVAFWTSVVLKLATPNLPRAIVLTLLCFVASFLAAATRQDAPDHHNSDP